MKFALIKACVTTKNIKWFAVDERRMDLEVQG